MFHCLFSKLSVTTSDPSGNHVGTAVPSPSWAYVAREGRAPLRLRRNAARPLRGGQSPFHNFAARRGLSPFHTFGCKKNASRPFGGEAFLLVDPAGLEPTT